MRNGAKARIRREMSEYLPSFKPAGKNSHNWTGEWNGLALKLRFPKKYPEVRPRISAQDGYAKELLSEATAKLNRIIYSKYGGWNPSLTIGDLMDCLKIAIEERVKRKKGKHGEIYIELKHRGRWNPIIMPASDTRNPLSCLEKKYRYCGSTLWAPIVHYVLPFFMNSRKPDNV
jgi:hypothetical protein